MCVRRYAEDAKPYTSKEFQQLYNGSVAWLFQWLDAPQEKHISSDKQAHTAGQYQRHEGASWKSSWLTTPEAIQVRLAQDGKAYTMAEFQQHDPDAWQQDWSQSPELPCTRCWPYKSGLALGAEVVV